MARFEAPLEDDGLKCAPGSTCVRRTRTQQRPRLESSVLVQGCMRDLLQVNRLLRCQGEFVTMRVYTCKPCESRAQTQD